jgi:hypothetical protein
MGDASVSLVRDARCPIFIIELPGDNETRLGALDFFLGLASAVENLAGLDVSRSQFRGVSIERLAMVLRTGIDVSPQDAAFYCGDFGKALEYGSWPKLVLALRTQSLDQTFREVSASLPQEEIEALRVKFPTMLRSTNGEMLWLSRLAESDTRLAKPYESDYGRWIPGDPWDALEAILILARPQDELAKHITSVVEGLS